MVCIFLHVVSTRLNNCLKLYHMLDISLNLSSLSNLGTYISIKDTTWTSLTITQQCICSTGKINIYFAPCLIVRYFSSFDKILVHLNTHHCTGRS